MKSLVVVGTGMRANEMFIDSLLENYTDRWQIIGLCDINPGRLEQTAGKVSKKNPQVKIYTEKEYDLMLQEQKPDLVLVTTTDCTHDNYICLALDTGIDVITEKPMTTDEIKCQKIVDTVNATGKSVRVTFNYRYSPPRSQVKEILMTGTIGRILSIEFQWLLDTSHGADYFRRWHRNKENSGGLLVHKATHHFDLINWWIADVPELVTSVGGRVFYLPEQAKRYGLEEHSDRCLTCSVSDKCHYFLDIKGLKHLRETYYENEKYDGYFRDKCVFSDQIDIEDSMNIAIQYKKGAFLSYNLNAFTPWEGYRVAFNGTKGRLEHTCQESSYIHGDGSIPGQLKPEDTTIKIFPHFKSPYEIEVRTGEGGHGGGDIPLLDDLFGQPDPDPLLRAASYTQGAYSILPGIAANKSIRSGKTIKVLDLVKGLGEPGYPENLSNDENLEFVANGKRMQHID